MSDSREQQLDEIIAAYLEAERSGAAPNREQLFARHPSLASELQSFLGNRDAFRHMTEPLVPPKDALPSAAVTLPPPGPKEVEPVTVGTNGAGAEPGTLLRYFGDYEIIEEIARGGMGVVYKARQVSLNRLVALKMILGGQLASTQDVQRFHTEAEAAANLDHPNIVPIHEVNQYQDQHYFSMKLIDGGSLADHMRRFPGDGRAAAELMTIVARAVHYAHQRGILHRDLKPANILLDNNGSPNITDFGLAKRVQADSDLTQSGAIVGTPSYMAPEQAEGKKALSTAVDVYSLGAIFYEALTGRPPFRAATTLDTVLQVIHNDPARPRSLKPGVDRDLETICLKCLQKDPQRRYASAEALADDLQHWLDGEPIQARPSRAWERSLKWARRRPAAAALVGVTALAAVSLLLLGMAYHQHLSFAYEEIKDQKQQVEKRGEELKKEREHLKRERDEKELARAEAEKHRRAAAAARDQAVNSLFAIYLNSINLAYQYWQGNNLAQSRRILDACPVAARAWEWRYLDRLHHADLVTLPGNGQFTTDLQFSKDGKRLAAFSPYGRSGVSIWDMTTNKTVTEVGFSKPPRQYLCSVLSADGRTIALGEQSGQVSFWDADTGQFLRDFVRMQRSVGSLSFSQDGRWLAAARADGRNGEMLLPFTEAPRNEDLVVWEVPTGKELFHPKGYGFAAKFSPDGSRLLTFKRNTGLRLSTSVPEIFVALFDTTSWTEVAAGKLGPAQSYSFSGNSKRLALGGWDRLRDVRFVRVVDPATGKELLSVAPKLVGDIALNRDGTILALAEGQGSTRIDIWDLPKRRQAQALRGHTNTVNAVAFSPDGRLASCSGDQTIKFWIPGNQEARQLAGPSAVLAMPAIFAHGGNVLAIAQRGSVNLFTGPVRTITLTDASTGRILHTLAGHQNGTRELAFSGDGKRLASGGHWGDAKIWDVATGAEVCSYRGHAGEISALALSPDGHWAASAYEPKEITEARFRQGAVTQPTQIPVPVKVWDATTGRERQTLTGHPGGVFRVAFSPDGRLLASAAYRLVKIWDLSTGKLIRELNEKEFQSGFAALMFSPKGNLLVTAGDPFGSGAGQTVQLWDVASGRSVALLQGHRSGKIDGLAFNADQTRLATSAGSEVKLWDVGSGQEALTLRLPEEGTVESTAQIVALAWSVDGQRLRAALLNGAVVEWDSTPKISR